LAFPFRVPGAGTLGGGGIGGRGGAVLADEERAWKTMPVLFSHKACKEATDDEGNHNQNLGVEFFTGFFRHCLVS